jgi:predicted ATPase
VHKNAERWWEAELHRLKGEVQLKQAEADEQEAEASFRQALDIARLQEAKSLERRVAMSVSRLWQQHGKRDEARKLLAPVMAGSPRAWTPPTSRRRRRYLTHGHE